MRSSTGATHAGATASMTMRGCSFFSSENSGCAINASPIQFGAITNARRIYVSSSLKNNAAHAVWAGWSWYWGWWRPTPSGSGVEARGVVLSTHRALPARDVLRHQHRQCRRLHAAQRRWWPLRKAGGVVQTAMPLSREDEDSMTLDRFAVFQLVARAAIR